MKYIREEERMDKKIVVAGTGYVGLSIAILLAQHNHVVAVDVVPEKVELINRGESPIQDEYMLWSSFFVTPQPNFCHRSHTTP